MDLNAVTFDVEGLTLAWAKSVPGLVGNGNPVGLMSLSTDIRSPQKGTMCTLRVTQSDVGPIGHAGRILFEVSAIGGEGGAKRQAERGARAIANAIRQGLDGTPRAVTSDGVTATLLAAHTASGPIWVGFFGQSIYRVEATFIWAAI